MDPITLILGAIVAGATTGALDGLKDEVKEKAKVAYGKLRGLITKRFQESGTASGELFLAEYEKNPKAMEQALRMKLTEAGANEDKALVAAAEELDKLVNPQAGTSGKYNVTFTNSRGVQIGDHSTPRQTRSRISRRGLGTGSGIAMPSLPGTTRGRGS